MVTKCEKCQSKLIYHTIKNDIKQVICHACEHAKDEYRINNPSVDKEGYFIRQVDALALYKLLKEAIDEEAAYNRGERVYGKWITNAEKLLTRLEEKINDD